MIKTLVALFENLAEKFKKNKFLKIVQENADLPKIKKKDKKTDGKKEKKHISTILKRENTLLSPQEVKLLSIVEDIRLEPDKTTAAFMARHLVQATLPHKNPGNVPAWSRRNGDLTLTIRPGWDHKKQKSIGYPYGTIPRLLLFWITTEAVRTRSRKLELGGNLAEFMRDVGLNYYTGGGKRGDIKRLKNQMERLLRANISLDIEKKETDVSRKRWLDMQVAPEGEFWWDVKTSKQSTLFFSWIELSDKFYEAIVSSPVPVDIRALRFLKRSPLALDLYAWATHTAYQTYKSGKERSISWEWLHRQFGAEYDKTDEFARNAWKALRKVKQVYPALNIDRVRGGINVLPSKPSIAVK